MRNHLRDLMMRNKYGLSWVEVLQKTHGGCYMGNKTCLDPTKDNVMKYLFGLLKCLAH